MKICLPYLCISVNDNNALTITDTVGIENTTSQCHFKEDNCIDDILRKKGNGTVNNCK